MKSTQLRTYIQSPLWWRYERRRLAFPPRLRKITDALFRVYELRRVSQGVTRILGPRFSRSRTLLEIDLTYVCSLRCQGCNRSIDKAPSDARISLEQIHHFIEESVKGGHNWKGIRLLGGEPTLHPDFPAILDVIREYRKIYRPDLHITVVSNGYSDRTKAALKKIPRDVWIENTAKISSVPIDFAPFNNAPRDYPEHTKSDFRNGCWITKGLGMGLTPLGYYHCAIAGGIDRIFNYKLGRRSIPNSEDRLYEQFEALCSLCGHFCINPPNATPTDGVSKSWHNAYKAWHQRQKTTDPSWSN